VILDTGTLIAITIALAGSCFVMVVSIRAYGKLMRENIELRKELTELNWKEILER
jgi:hypothetical protein